MSSQVPPANNKPASLACNGTAHPEALSLAETSDSRATQSQDHDTSAPKTVGVDSPHYLSRRIDSLHESGRDELERKLAELEQLVEATDTAIICLDAELRIRSFTPAASRLFKIETNDRGRSLSSLNHVFCDDDLVQVARNVLESLSSHESDVLTINQQLLVRQVKPLCSAEGVVVGVAVSFLDFIVDGIQQSQLSSHSRARCAILDIVSQPLLILDANLHVLRANEAFCKWFRVSRQEMEGSEFFKLRNGQWDITPIRILLDQVLSAKSTNSELEVRACLDQIGKRTLLINANYLEHLNVVVLGIKDETEEREAKSTLSESEEMLRMAAQAAHFGSYSHDLIADRGMWSPELYEIFGLTKDTPVTEQIVTDCIHTDDRARFIQYAEQVMSGVDEDEYSAEFRVVRPSGETRWIKDRGRTLFSGKGDSRRPVRVIGMVADVSDQRRAEPANVRQKEFLEEQVAERVQAMTILQNVAIAANEATSVEQAIDTTLRTICELSPWVLGHAYQTDTDSGGKRCMRSTGISYINESRVANAAQRNRLKAFQRACSIASYAEGEGAVGLVLETGTPVWTYSTTECEIQRRVALSEFGLKTSIAFPIKVHGEVAAVLECLSDRAAKKESQFMQILSNVGIQLGHVIERHQLERKVAETAEYEQRRIGSDIHDGIGQELSGLRYLAQTHAESLESSNLPDQKIANRIAVGLETVQKQLRSIIRDLVPVEVDEKGLPAALAALARKASQESELTCVFECHSYVSAADVLQATHFYRVAQEAVNNAKRHAHADRIAICLADDGHQVTLSIGDNGVGIDLTLEHRQGFGLHSMAYRAKLMGGQLSINAPASGGTTIVCTVPQTQSREVKMS